MILRFADKRFTLKGFRRSKVWGNVGDITVSVLLDVRFAGLTMSGTSAVFLQFGFVSYWPVRYVVRVLF